MRDVWIFIGIVASLFVAVFLFVAIPIWAGSYYVDRSHCRSFGQQTNRQVKFEVLVKAVVPLQWDCFTPTAGGKWIPTQNLREFGQQP